MNKENNHPGFCKSETCQSEECALFQGRSVEFGKAAEDDIIDKVQDYVYGLNLDVDGEEYKEILGQIKNSIWLRGEIQRALSKAIASAVEANSKAFGGCLKCYGKGYATHIEFYSGNGEADMGQGNVVIEGQAPYYIPCSCERGKQFEAIINPSKE